MSVDGRTHWLPNPFLVIATQNPYEQAGIFPLPESQLDRFLFKIHLEYQSAAIERAILRLPHRALAPDVLGDVTPLFDVARLQVAQEELEATPAPDDVIAYIVEIIRGTREAAGVDPRCEPPRGRPPARRVEGTCPAHEPPGGHARGRRGDGPQRAAASPDRRGRRSRPGRDGLDRRRSRLSSKPLSRLRSRPRRHRPPQRRQSPR